MSSSTWLKKLQKLNSFPTCFFSDYDKLSEEEKQHLTSMSANIDNDFGEWMHIQEKKCKFVT